MFEHTVSVGGAVSGGGPAWLEEGWMPLRVGLGARILTPLPVGSLCFLPVDEGVTSQLSALAALPPFLCLPCQTDSPSGTIS